MSADTYPYEPITMKRLDPDTAMELAKDTELALCRHCGQIIARPLDGGEPMESWRLAATESSFCPAGGDSEQFCEPVRADVENTEKYGVVWPAWLPRSENA